MEPTRGCSVADVYLYADESGNLDYDAPHTNSQESPYFGFGTAVFEGEHGSELWDGLQLRARLESRGLNLPKGFHAKNDSHSTRDEMFALLAGQAPRIDTTFLWKPGAYPSVRARGEMYLYKMAWFQHFKYVGPRVAAPHDRLFVVAGSFGTKARQTEARGALSDVCDQINREIVLCVWDSSSSWGLQLADYALWAVHRDLQGRVCSWYASAVQPSLRSRFMPWGRE